VPVAPWWEEFGSAASDDADGAAPAPAGPPPAAAPAADPLEVRRTPRRRPRDLLALQVSAAVLAVALLGLLGALAVRGGPAASAGAVGTPASSVPSSAPASPAAPPATDDTAALQELEVLRARGLAEHPPAGQWAAQLAAKSIGTTDPAQVATNGSHTFYAGDILAQSRAIAAGPAGADVFVLRSDDYGKGSIDARGNPYWTTLAAGPFASAADVRTWCDSVFGGVPAATRGNVCLPRQLLPVG